MTNIDTIIEQINQLKEKGATDITPNNIVDVDPDNPFFVGAKYLIRTVTFTYVGKLQSIGEKELVLTNCSWVADTGRFNKAFTDGLEEDGNSEIEVMHSPFVVIGRGALIDAAFYDKDLPTESK